MDEQYVNGKEVFSALGHVTLQRIQKLQADEAAYNAQREAMAQDAFGVGYAESLELDPAVQEKMLDDWIERKLAQARSSYCPEM